MTAQRTLSVFFTAGYPRRDDTISILKALQSCEVDFVEVGFPFSDPIADGPTIQQSNHVALANGMTVEHLFDQLAALRDGEIALPVLLMGYLNPVEQFGRERFFESAARCGVDGLILPDMPFDEYLSTYKPLFQKHKLKPVFLVTSRTDEERIRAFDAESPAFLYVLSSDAVTGGRAHVTDEREAFFQRLKNMRLASRLIVGFGVSDRESFNTVTKHTSGAIIGSAFVRALSGIPQGATQYASQLQLLNSTVSNFIKQVR
jgi:tryptophan synthase alpha chain